MDKKELLKMIADILCEDVDDLESILLHVEVAGEYDFEFVDSVKSFVESEKHINAVISLLILGGYDLGDMLIADDDWGELAMEAFRRLVFDAKLAEKKSSESNVDSNF